MIIVRVLIVDDDRIIREDIKRLIDWEANGYKLAGDAANGAEALEILKKTNLDIILTDIYMPLMNGVELIKAVKKEHNDIQIIVMSNYDDFSYVKDAMKYGALDYILKYHINESSLMDVLKSAASEVDKARRENSEKAHLIQVADKEAKKSRRLFFKDYLDGIYQSKLAANKYEELDIELPQWEFMTIYVKADHSLIRDFIDNETVFGNIAYFQIDLEGELFFLVHFNQKSYLSILNRLNGIVKKISTCIEAIRNIVIYSTNLICFDDLPNEAFKMRYASRLFFYTGPINILIDNNSILFSDELDYKVFEELENKIISSIQNTLPQEFEISIDSMTLKLSDKKYNPDIIITELKLLLQRIIKFIRNTYNYMTDTLTSLEALLLCIDNKFFTLNDFSSKLKEIINNYFNRFENGFTNVIKIEISDAIKYIQKNYKRNITLIELAEYVGLSKNHLCMLFKQETGDNFTDYVNKLRIKEAKFLIMEKNYRVKQASLEVGINNQRYFCKLFKHFTGYSPMVYKNRRAV